MPPVTAPDASFAPLVYDSDGPELRRYRSTDEPPDMTGVATAGLSALRCSGSAQLSAAGFAALRARLAHVPPALLHVVDLRQESHGFLNGAAVSWYARSNWGCVGLAEDEALALEQLRLRLLAAAEWVEVASAADVKQSKQSKQGATLATVEVRPERVEDEAQVLALPPGQYVRLPVADHARPSDAVVERFVRFVDALDADAHLHFHCRGGKGRTVTFFVLLDLLRSGDQRPLAAILDRQQRLHDYDMRRLPELSAAKAPTIRERLEFVEEFARFAHARRRGDGWLEFIAGRGE